MAINPPKMTDKLRRTRQRLQTPHTGDGRSLFHPIVMMHAARQAGFTYEEFMRDARKLVEANLRCVELYGMDAVSAISDPYRETSAFGAGITFNGDAAPKASRVIHSTADIPALKRPDVESAPRTRDRIQACRLLREAVGPQFPVIGWVEGPLAEACDLMGMGEAMMAMMLEPEAVKELLQKTLLTAKDFAAAQIRAGADVIGVGDAVCSQIDASLYADFCTELHRDLFDYIHEQGALVKLHICGDITHLLPHLAQEEIDILDIDHMVDMPAAHRAMGPDVLLAGNLDPVAVMLEGGKELIAEKFQAIRTSIPQENWIVMPGCEIPPAAPPENIKFLRALSLNP